MATMALQVCTSNIKVCIVVGLVAVGVVLLILWKTGLLNSSSKVSHCVKSSSDKSKSVTSKLSAKEPGEPIKTAIATPPTNVYMR